MTARVLVVLALCAVGLPSKVVVAETRHYLVAIGNNERPVGADDDAASVLRYADDDAASVVSLWREIGAETHLLTVLDADSRRRFPALGAAALPPSLKELRRVIGDLRQRFENDRRAGNDPVLVFYYSGHGSLKAGEVPSLAMLDGGLTRAILYDEILAVLPARYVHLIIDACHAEAIVRPRDAQAELAPVDEHDLEEYAAKNTLRRFPNVGAVIATSSTAETHEWDQYQRGIFTFQVLSALRGAADVNGDGLVEYSELSAFLGAANAAVIDPRARLSVVTRPPAINPRAPIAELVGARGHAAFLTGTGPGIGRFFVEDERGNRLGELSPELGFRFELMVPCAEELYVRTASDESSFHGEPGARIDVASLRFSSRSARSRGAVESSFRRGLFATAFGPTYYRGFVDARVELPSVMSIDLRSAPSTVDVSRREIAGPSVRTVGWTLAGVGAVGLTAGTILGIRVASKNHEIDATCNGSGTCLAADQTRYNSDVAEAKTARTWSIVGFAAGGAALASVLVVVLLSGQHHGDDSLTMTASVGTDGVGARLGGRW